jgi:hypothetical protein
MVVGAAMMSGCYSYVPVERPTPGTVVRVDVPVRSAMAGRAIEEDVASMEGRLLSAGDSIVLEMASMRELGNFRQIRSVDTLRVARADLVGVSTREFSKPKTVVLTAVLLGATIGLAVAALDVAGGSQGGKNGNGNPTTSIVVKPVFSALMRALGR